MTRLIDLPEMVVRDVAELPDRTSPDDQPDMMLVTAAELDRIVTSRIAEVTNRALDVIGHCAACVPSNWLDPLLTGPKKIAEFHSGQDVERLLNAVRERIRTLAQTERGGQPAATGERQ